MSGAKKRTPTNKLFKDHFQGIAGTKTKKGHLNNQDKEGNTVKEVGVLVRIEKAKMYEDGWYVEVGTGSEKTTYKCIYTANVVYIPESTETDLYYIPKGKCEVDVSLDKKTKVYHLTNIKSDNKKPLALYENKLIISTNTDTNTNSNVKSSIEVTNDKVNINSDNITLTDSNNNTVDLLESQQTINELKEENTSLLKRIEILEEKVNSNDDDGE